MQSRGGVTPQGTLKLELLFTVVLVGERVQALVFPMSTHLWMWAALGREHELM